MLKGKRILAIVDSVEPNLTMNGIVAKNILDILAKDNDVLLISVKRDQNDAETKYSHKIKYIKGFHYYQNILYKKIKKERGVKKKISEIRLYIIRSLYLLMRMVSSYGVDDIGTGKFRKQIAYSIDKENVDFIVIFSVPFEPMIAILKIIKERALNNVILFAMDDFIDANDKNLRGIFWRRRKINRIRIGNECAENFLRYYMIESVYEKECKYYKKNTVKKIGMPLIIENEYVKEGKYEKSQFTFVYTGSLMKNDRNPIACLKIFEKIVGRTNDINFCFYHRGDCSDIIQKYAGHSNGKIRDCGSVSSEQARRAVGEADILFAISTRDGDQVSGKTFDYISTGHPIIFFYYATDDANLKVYDKYEYFLPVKLNEDNVEENANMICMFTEQYKGKHIPFRAIKERFNNYVPQVITGQLFESL